MLLRILGSDGFSSKRAFALYFGLSRTRIGQRCSIAATTAAHAKPVDRITSQCRRTACNSGQTAYTVLRRIVAAGRHPIPQSRIGCHARRLNGDCLLQRNSRRIALDSRCLT